MKVQWATLLLGAGAGVAAGVVVAGLARRLAGGRPVAPIWLVMGLQAALAIWGTWSSDGGGMAVVSLPLSAALLTLALVDVRTLRLPDVITLPLIGAGILAAAIGGVDAAARCIGAAAGFLALSGLAFGFRRLRGRDGIGMGDAKLLAAAGAWLGWRALPWMVLTACGAAFVWVAVRRLLRGRETLTQPLPFGAPLALAFWIVWLYGAPES
ncbi:MAG: A24 family peptidase [Caulobacteraceae bacterium]